MAAIDAVVAGAGIWGCTLARRLAEAGRKVLVLDKRPVAGGNVRCEIDEETGIEIHSYGSHIFHTHIPEVWDFLNRFVTFNGYQHKVLAKYCGKTYFLPLGLALINKFFNVELAPNEVDAFMKDERNSSAIFDAFFRGYTSKQWGRSPEEIDPSIIKRVPVRLNWDVNYFNDYNQGIPVSGYNSLFDNLLDHTNISCSFGVEVRLENGVIVAGDDKFSNVPVFYSGPIDALFGYKFGYLPWRSLRFETEKLDIVDYQGTSVVNYTEAEIPYTRIHEFKHYHPECAKIMASPKTIIMREYSKTWQVGDEPYYPVDCQSSRELLEKYMIEAARIPNLTIGGRLGSYKYYDMDKSIEAALKVRI
jgi:UDP-galactopyranose mutase